MVEIPVIVRAGGVEFERVESPPEIACWSAEVPAGGGRAPVSLVVEPAAVPSPTAVATLAAIPSRFDELVAVAVDYLRERLAEESFALSPDERAALAADAAPFAAPEAVVWADGTWMLRFGEAPLAMAEPFGVGVDFVGEAPQGVDDLSAADEV